MTIRIAPRLVIRDFDVRSNVMRSLQRKTGFNIQRRARLTGEAAVHNCNVYAMQNFQQRIPDRRRDKGGPRAVGSFSYTVVGDELPIRLKVGTSSQGARIQQAGSNPHRIPAQNPKGLVVPYERFKYVPEHHTQIPTLTLLKRRLAGRPMSVNHPGSIKHRDFMTKAVADAIGYVAHRYRRR